MTTSRTGQTHLTDNDLRELRELQEEGKRATVYLREPIAGLGLDEGASARVLSIEGSSLIVKPTGVNDEIPFEAHELRRTRAAPQPAKRAPRKKAAATAGRPPAPKGAGLGAPGPGVEVPATKPPAPKPPAAPKPAPTAGKPPAGSSAGPAKPSSPRAASDRTAPGTSGKPRGKSAECAITLRADEEGAWSIEVDRPGGLSLKRSTITPDAVLRAIQQLDHPGALRAAQAALNAARKAAEQRVAELRKELAEAESALESLKAD
ncbi:translation initiation factor [Lolliginicoccus suaedae]|uniref:translation initiation factor n=1 Tax=Lolliginicoccus suaedae TaxID=2605429 RepID=UPI0011EF599C|nr:translation initiation factor [Lolliginicoccus suaedae]